MPASNSSPRPEPIPQAERLFLRGVQCHRQHKNEAASRAMRRVLTLQPDHLDATLWSGILAYQRGQTAIAADWFQRTLRLDPKLASAHYNLGLCLHDAGNHKAALAAYEQAIALQPDQAEAYNNRGLLLAELGDYGRAIANYQIALACRPGYLAARFNQGVAHAAQGQFQLAEQDYLAVTARDPAHSGAQFALAILWLTLGNWSAGWPQYEWRWRYPAAGLCPPEPAAPPWDGQSTLEGKHLLLDAEQGLGDTLQFCRFIPHLQAQGARITLRAPAPLLPLLQAMPCRCEILPTGAAVTADYQLALMSLPARLGITPSNIPGARGYLKVPESYQLRWQERLGPRSRVPRIGLVWAGNPNHRQDAQRSLPLRQLLDGLPAGYQYLALQKTLQPEDQAPLARRDDIYWLGNELLDFADTAAVCQQLDVLISVDTAVAHLAGGLGVPVWILLPHIPDWRWQLQGETSGWYDSARLFRQTHAGFWPSVLEQLFTELTQLSHPEYRLLDRVDPESNRG